MEKSTLKQIILRSYQSLDPSEYTEIESALSKMEETSSDTSEMAKKFVENPELRVLHEAFLRKKAELTNNSASTIKMITVVYFIGSIISAFYLFNKFLGN